jgi:hypothetical protein
MKWTEGSSGCVWLPAFGGFLHSVNWWAGVREIVSDTYSPPFWPVASHTMRIEAVLAFFGSLWRRTASGRCFCLFPTSGGDCAAHEIRTKGDLTDENGIDYHALDPIHAQAEDSVPSLEWTSERQRDKAEEREQPQG